MRTKSGSSPMIIRFIISACFISISVTSLLAATTTFRLQNGSAGVGTTYTGAEDTYLRQQYPLVSPGKFPEMHLGFDNLAGGGKVRGLIRFDMSDFKAGWGAATVLKAARLQMRVTGNQGLAFSNKTIYLYRVSAANKAWAAGSQADRSTPAIGAACWSWIDYDNTNYAPTDQANCPNPAGGCPRRHPWAGDVSAYTAAWPALTGFTGSGCGVAGTDYVSIPVASVVISSTDIGAGGTWVTFTFSDISFLTDWMNTPTNNAGFLIRATDIETGTSTAYSLLKIASCENSTQNLRPILELDIDNYTAVGGNTITYDLPSSGKVSMSVYDSTGCEVRKLLVVAPRSAGANMDFWNCKTDSINYGDAITTVPDGRYTVKILSTPGLSNEYMGTLGSPVNHWEGWPGNSAGNPRTVCTQDTTAVYLPAKGFWHGEGCVTGVRIKPNGTRLTTYPLVGDGGVGAIYATACSWDNGKLYLFDGANVWVQSDPTIATGGTLTKIITNLPFSTGYTSTAASAFGSDMAVYNGKILLSSEIEKKIQWRSATDGALIQELTLTSAPFGVAIDNDGKGLVITQDKVVAYTEGSTAAPVTVIAAGALDGGYRLDVNRANGDIYVVEGGIAFNRTGNKHYPVGSFAPTDWEGVHPFDSTGQQVKRFSSVGALQGTFGVKGGRPEYGAYVATNYRCVGDIAVATDGSYWICEDGTWTCQTLPRRVGHFDKNGALVKDFIGGMAYAATAEPDPDDPTIVWIPQSYGVIRCKVDWVNKSWSVLGCYKMHFPILQWGNSHTWRANIVKRNNKTYFMPGNTNATLYFDETRDEIYPVAFNGSSQKLWYYLNGLPNPDSLALATNAATIVTSVRGGIAIPSYLGAEPWGCWGGNLTSWYDKDGNGDYMQKDEWAWADNYNKCIANANSAVDQFGNLYGSVKATPVWHTVNGVDMPEYDFNNAVWVSSYLDSAARALGTPINNAENWLDGLDSTRFIPGRTMWMHKAPGQNNATSLMGMEVDDSGNVFHLYTGFSSSLSDTGLNAFEKSKRKVMFQNIMAKFDRNGKCLWSNRLKFSSGKLPNPGELSMAFDSHASGFFGSFLWSTIGSARKCLFAVDQTGSVNYVWDEDGLFVGSMFDNMDPAVANVTWTAPVQWGCGEQFAGRIFEVRNNTTPGLAKGDVLFLLAGQNDIPVFRIHGFNQFTKLTTMITVTGGKITGQTDVNVAVKAAGPAFSRINLSVYGQRNPLITYELATKAKVTLEVYTVLGRKVATLVDGMMDAGTHSVATTNSAQGVRSMTTGYYLVRLSVGDKRMIKQMVMVK